MKYSIREELKLAIKEYFTLQEKVRSCPKFYKSIIDFRDESTQLINNYFNSRDELEKIIKNLSPEEFIDELISLVKEWGSQMTREHTTPHLCLKGRSDEAAEIIKKFSEAEERLKLYYSMNLRSNFSSSALNKSAL